MSKLKRKARQTLEVTIMFELSRLASEHLADVYMPSGCRYEGVKRHGLAPRAGLNPMRCRPDEAAAAMSARPVSLYDSVFHRLRVN